MIRQRMTTRLAILFLLLGTTMAWSQRTHRPKPTHVAAEESKISSRYSHEPKSSSYILDDHDHYPKVGGDSEEEYLEDEEVKSHREQDEAQGKEESDDSVKNDEYLDHSEKGGHKAYKEGGSSFDKHLKDHKADNKEVENVKQHDVGEKFGGEATKEHKLGKHKEKSKGHKLHGFKNVYHKEEYGDHKTFHDEFLDTDHQHNYDDHHEHQELQGGKFSKGFKHEGKNKKYDKGDEKHDWGKEEYDGHHEGKHESGRQSSKHRHGSKKHQGQYDANGQRNKNSVHKVKKGAPPPYVPHGGHHGPHQAQIQPVISHYNHHHHDPGHVQSHLYKPHSPHHHHHHQSHNVQFDDDDKHSIHNSDHGNHGYHNHGDHHKSHGGHHDDDHFSQEDDHDSGYHERTSRNHKHKSPTKDQSEEKSDEKFLMPISKQEPIAYRNEPILPAKSFVSKLEPIAQKQSVSPNYGIHRYRQPVFQEGSHFKPSEPVKQEKYPLTERSHDHNQRIRYGFQPRNHHNQHHHSHHSPQSHFSQHHQEQKFPRFPGFSSHHHHQQQPQPQPQSHGHHHRGNNQKSHNHFRYAPSSYQQESKPAVHVPKAEYTSSIKPVRNEGHQSFSQKLYK